MLALADAGPRGCGGGLSAAGQRPGQVALFASQRLDFFALLSAIAGRTSHVLLSPACMGSFALREPRVFAAKWASLDVISGGRTRLSVCGGAGPAWDASRFVSPPQATRWSSFAG